jgi:hypothetical protein
LHNLDLYTPEDKQLNYAAYLLADNNNISIKVAKYAGTDKCDLIENPTVELTGRQRGRK